jgi:hypothetical protein
MHVVRFYRQVLDLYIKLGRLLPDKRIEVFSNLVNQDGEAVLRAPDKHVSEIMRDHRSASKPLTHTTYLVVEGRSMPAGLFPKLLTGYRVVEVVEDQCFLVFRPHSELARYSYRSGSLGQHTVPTILGYPPEPLREGVFTRGDDGKTFRPHLKATLLNAAQRVLREEATQGQTVGYRRDDVLARRRLVPLPCAWLGIVDTAEPEEVSHSFKKWGIVAVKLYLKDRANVIAQPARLASGDGYREVAFTTHEPAYEALHPLWVMGGSLHNKVIAQNGASSNAPHKVIVQIANTARCMPKLQHVSVQDLLDKHNLSNRKKARSGLPLSHEYDSPRPELSYGTVAIDSP